MWFKYLDRHHLARSDLMIQASYPPSPLQGTNLAYTPREHTAHPMALVAASQEARSACMTKMLRLRSGIWEELLEEV
jgi:hypothetical protein